MPPYYRCHFVTSVIIFLKMHINDIYIRSQHVNILTYQTCHHAPHTNYISLLIYIYLQLCNNKIQYSISILILILMPSKDIAKSPQQHARCHLVNLKVRESIKNSLLNVIFCLDNTKPTKNNTPSIFVYKALNLYYMYQGKC